MSYVYLGYGTTNSEGVAKLDHNAQGQEISHSYTGVGAGEIDVLASLDNPIVEGSIVSETFKVMDTLLYDTGTDPLHNIWTGDTSNLTRNSEYSRLEESTIGTPVQINTVMPTGLWVLTMSIKRDGHSTNWDITILNNNVSVFGCATPTNDVWTDITLVYDGSFIYYFENGSTTPVKKTSVMLDDTKNTVLRLQTPQDITYVDFKDLIVLREGQSNISIGSSNPVIQSGDTTTINGSLYESGLLVKNATLDVYKNGSKVGTASTGDSGVASYTYTGVGDGEVEFQFKYGNISSGTFSVIDTIFYDKGILNDPQTNDNWFNQDNGFDVTRGDSYTLLERKTTGYKRFIPDANSLTSYPFSIGTCIEFTLGTVNGTWIFTIPKTSESLSNLDIGLISDSNKIIKITVGETNITIEKDGTVVDTKPTSNYVDDDFQCYFIINSVNSIQYKDFKVYPI